MEGRPDHADLGIPPMSPNNRRAMPTRATRREFVTAVTVGTAALAAAATIDGVSAQPAAAPVILITGANRGLGLEFTRQYAAKGWRVIATCRNPKDADALRALADANPEISIDRLDVLEHDMIDSLADKYKGVAIDILLNNAGINASSSAQIFGKFDYDLFDLHLRTNALGPMKMAEAFLDHVAASDGKRIMSLSSGMGSIADAARFRGLLTFYRMSKASLNMGMKILAVQLKAKGLIVGILDPGLVDTDQSKDAPVPKIQPAESISGLIEVIEGYTLETSGHFMSYDGRELPW